MLDLITLTHSAGAILEHHEEPTAWLLTPGGWVAMSMLAVFAIMLKAKVPAIVAGMLDKKIASIREQLDAASALRAEAEALKAEYLAKANIAAMRAAAAKDADDIVAKAKVDATALIARRTKMAEEKISAAERAAVSEIRAKTAAAAAAAAADLIGRGHGVKADAKLIDTAISQLN
jgi:F-type H+-transporting ATPase subunit b